MADVLELVAVEHGFRDGALIKPGERFKFSTTRKDKDGKPRIPKWAAFAGDERLKAKPPENVDTRPIATAAASKRKTMGSGRAEME